MTTTYITQDEVTVSTSSSMCGNAKTNAASGAGTAAGAVEISVVSNDPKKNNEILKLRDMLLTDTSVESS